MPAWSNKELNSKMRDQRSTRSSTKYRRSWRMKSGWGFSLSRNWIPCITLTWSTSPGTSLSQRSMRSWLLITPSLKANITTSRASIQTWLSSNRTQSSSWRSTNWKLKWTERTSPKAWTNSLKWLKTSTLKNKPSEKPSTNWNRLWSNSRSQSLRSKNYKEIWSRRSPFLLRSSNFMNRPSRTSPGKRRGSSSS